MRARPGALLLSCRSHYFKTIRDQNAAFTGNDRDRVRADDYRAMVLLPFNERQVRQYLGKVLGEERVEAALGLCASVHNLTELSSRPYLLSLIAEHVGELEVRRAEGRVVRGVTLYELLVDRWLSRDSGKHHILPEDKLRLMEDLAAALWREGLREWPWERVHQWLGGRMAGDPAMLLRYSRQDPAVVEEDFRTATFVLRPDDSPDRFRFAHTSMHEFFLAKALLRALRDGHDEDCSMARPSPETLDFLGQLLDCADPGDRHTALETLARLLSDYEAGATELAMAYWLVAVKKGLPEPSPGRVDLRGADLSEWEFRGRSAESLFPLAGARLTRARLLRTRFEFVDLSGADLSQVWAEGAEFRHSVASGLRLDKANLATTVWRHCTMHPLVDADRGNWYQAQVAHSEVDPDGLPKDFCGHATISHSRSPSGQPLQVPAVKSTEASLSVLLEHRAEVTACAWSGLGHRIVTGSRKGTLKVWDADTAQCLSTLVGHSDGVWACAWSSQGDRVVSASFDGTLRVWDAQSGQCLRTLVGHSDWVRACAWSGQGDRVVSGSDDGTLRVWDAESGQEVMTMVNGPGGEWAAVDLPGNRILAASAEAWRFLGWEWLDPATRQVRVLPAEHFGELPST